MEAIEEDELPEGFNNDIELGKNNMKNNKWLNDKDTWKYFNKLWCVGTVKEILYRIKEYKDTPKSRFWCIVFILALIVIIIFAYLVFILFMEI